MGGSPSKKIEDILEASEAFQLAVDSSYEECMISSQHRFSGLQAYELLTGAVRVYDKLSAIEDDDAIMTYKKKSLPQPPSQLEVDRTIRKEKLFDGGNTVVSLEDFRVFATTLFKDMGLTTACHRLAVYVPASTIGVLVTHLVVQKLPLVGSAYRGAGALMPGLLLGSVVGVVMSQLNPV